MDYWGETASRSDRWKEGVTQVINSRGIQKKEGARRAPSSVARSSLSLLVPVVPSCLSSYPRVCDQSHSTFPLGCPGGATTVQVPAPSSLMLPLKSPPASMMTETGEILLSFSKALPL